MEIQGTAVGGRLRITEHDTEIGHIDRSGISFTGFGSPTDAARAAWESYRSLEFSRTGTAILNDGGVSIGLGVAPSVLVEGRGQIARLLPPAGPATRFDQWGFVMPLSPEEEQVMHRTSPEVFLRARARRMWRGIQKAGLNHRTRHVAPNDVTISKGENNVIHTD